MKQALIDLIFDHLSYRQLCVLYPLYLRIRKGTVYQKMVTYLEQSSNEEIRKLLPSIKQAGYLKFFYGDWTIPYETGRYPIDLRRGEDGFYIRHKLYDGRTEDLYMPHRKGAGNCKLYYQTLLLDQDMASPHRYLTEDNFQRIRTLRGTVLDLGAAEGNFSLEMTKITDHIICFEPDGRMQAALRKTLKNAPNVTIVDKLVGETTDSANNTVSIDDYFGDAIPEDISVIKMDIEGYEQATLRGMRRTLKKNPQAILLICAYHQQQAEKEICEILQPLGYEIHPRKGYMFFHEFVPFEAPYYRRGVLEARMADQW